MKIFRTISAAAFVTLMSSTASFASVTAQDVWADWNDHMSAVGFQVTSQQSTSDGTLNIHNLTATTALPNNRGTLKITFANLALKNRDDGTVAVSMSQHNPIILNMTTKNGKPVRLEMDYFQTGLSMIVSGSTDKMAYASTASTMGIELKNFSGGGENASGTITAKLAVGNLISSYTSTKGTLRTASSTANADSLTYEVSVAAPEGTGSFSIKGALDGLKSWSRSALPEDISTTDMSASFKAGFAASGALSYNAGRTEWAFDDKGKKFSGTSTSDGGTIESALDRTKIHYALSGKNIVATFAGSQIPVPSLTLKLAEYAFGVTMPVEKSDTPQDFALNIKLGDFALPDVIWAMGDPMGVLPHDPATINLDLAGKARWFFNLFDPKAQAEMKGKQPGELDTLTLNTLQIKAAGADLTGSGAVTFDNGDKTTFGGVPKPVGAVDLKLVGGNGLLDKLVQMGLISKDKATGFRMMTGIFAKAGDGPDTLVSKIELTQDGRVLANEQRLK